MLSTVFLPMARTGALVAMPFSRLVPFTSASRLMKTPGMMLTPCTVLYSSTAVIFVAVHRVDDESRQRIQRFCGDGSGQQVGPQLRGCVDVHPYACGQLLRELQRFHARKHAQRPRHCVGDLRHHAGNDGAFDVFPRHLVKVAFRAG